MLFARVCTMPCMVRPIQRFAAGAAGKRTAATASTLLGRGTSLLMDGNARRHISVVTLLGGPASPLIGSKFAAFKPAYVHSGVDPACSTSISNNDSTGEGAVTCAGDDEDTDGTESGRVSRDTALSDGPPDEESESIKQAHVAAANNTEGSCETSVDKFKEYGNVYDKHEPTMFGDWSHMGRVTDF